MKTLKTLSLLLLMAFGAMAQPNPSNMFISGYVVDGNGLAQSDHHVCVEWVSNSPSLPSDSICTTTNANGYYYLDVPNGSLTGPNVNFTVTTYDPCSFLPLTQTVSNNQGTVDQATVSFAICANTGGCDVSLTSTQNPNDTSSYTFVATATGVSPFSYDWDNGQTGSSATYSFTQEGVYGVCVTITDATGCTSWNCDTIVIGGNNPCNLQVTITTTVDSTPNGVFWVCTASGGFASYQWSNGATGQTITLQNVGPNGDVICLTVADANGCTATACDTLLPFNGAACEAAFWYPGSPSGVLEVGNSVELAFTGVANNNSDITWTISGGGLVFTAYGTNPVFQIPPTLIPVNGIAVQICVTVDDPATGCSDSYCENVLAVVDSTGGGGCQSYFTWYPDSVLGSPLPGIWFTDASQGGASYFWDFGDNSISTEQNPIHLYTGTGTYTVCLTIVSADQSCTDTYCETVYVGGNSNGCDASFSNSGPTPIGYTFTANTQDPNLYYEWYIDGQYVGNGSEAYSPGFANGVHTVCLTIIDSLLMCSDNQCITISVGVNNCYGYISGQVFAGSSNQPLDEGVVYLITYDELTGQLTAVDSMVIDSSNYFFFGPVACGSYLIKAAAYPGSQYYNSYIPTYYGNSPFWGFAETVTIAQVNTQVLVDVTLIASNNPGGPGFIGGDVAQGANKMDEGDPLANMQVMLFDLSGTALACTYTDGNGQFGFDNLPYGTYQVYVEVLGVQTIPAIVTISANEPSVTDVHILASESLISTGIAEFDFEGAIGQVYPNPAAQDANVALNLFEGAMVDVSISDLTGRRISTLAVSISAGENNLKLNVADLKAGYYFLNIQEVEGKFSITRKFMRVD
jgi:PKD repeat protein